MNPASVLKSTSSARILSYCFFLVKRNNNHSFTSKFLLNFFISVLFSFSLFAQDSTIKFTQADFKKNHGDSIQFDKKYTTASIRNNLPGIPSPLEKDRMRLRVKIIAATNVIGYGAAMVGLYSAWYKNYPQSNFHTFNDIPEWKGIDKIGHAYSVYAESLASTELWRWTGISRKKRIWIGGLSGPVYHTVI